MSAEDAARRIVELEAKRPTEWEDPLSLTIEQGQNAPTVARAYLAALKVVEAARALDKVIAEFPDYPAAWAECIAAQETALAAYDKEAGR